MKAKIPEPSMVSEFISDSDVSFVSLLLLIFFIYSMPHNLHGNILRKCLEAENGSA